MTDLQSAQLSTNFASTTNFRGDIMKKKLLSKLLVCTLALQTAFASTVSMPANTKKASAALTGKSPFTNSTYTHNDTFSGYNIIYITELMFQNTTITTALLIGTKSKKPELTS